MWCRPESTNIDRVLSGQHHIMSNASIVNNCIICTTHLTQAAVVRTQRLASRTPPHVSLIHTIQGHWSGSAESPLWISLSISSSSSVFITGLAIAKIIQAAEKKFDNFGWLLDRYWHLSRVTVHDCWCISTDLLALTDTNKPSPLFVNCVGSLYT